MKILVKAWERELEALHERLGGQFSRSESRQRSLSYLKGLLGTVERKNGWQLAEWIGDSNPDGVQLNRYHAVYSLLISSRTEWVARWVARRNFHG